MVSGASTILMNSLGGCPLRVAARHDAAAVLYAFEMDNLLGLLTESSQAHKRRRLKRCRFVRGLLSLRFWLPSTGESGPADAEASLGSG